MSTKTSIESTNEDAVGQWSEKYSDIENDIPRSKIQLLEQWYLLTAPPIPPANAGLEQREIVRRGRLSSTILLILLGIIFCLALPVAIIQHLFGLMMILAIMLIGITISLLLNRRGRISSAAWLPVAMTDIGLCISIVTSPGPGGLTANSVPLYDLMIMSELIAVSLLPPGNVFFIAIFNSAFVITSLTFWKHADSLNTLLAQAGPEVYARPIVLHFIVAFVTYLWVRSATQAIARADRAEVIAALEHQMAKQEHTLAQQKHQLDHSINQVIETLTRVANGDFNARVPLTQDNVLWQVAGSLNNLLTRLQRLRYIEAEMQKAHPHLQRVTQLEYELTRTMREAKHLAVTLQRAKISRQPIRAHSAGTLLDPVIAELNSSTLLQPPALQENNAGKEEAFSPSQELPRTSSRFLHGNNFGKQQ